MTAATALGLGVGLRKDLCDSQLIHVSETVRTSGVVVHGGGFKNGLNDSYDDSFASSLNRGDNIVVDDKKNMVRMTLSEFTEKVENEKGRYMRREGGVRLKGSRSSAHGRSSSTSTSSSVLPPPPPICPASIKPSSLQSLRFFNLHCGDWMSEPFADFKRRLEDSRCEPDVARRCATRWLIRAGCSISMQDEFSRLAFVKAQLFDAFQEGALLRCALPPDFDKSWRLMDCACSACSA